MATKPMMLLCAVLLGAGCNLRELVLMKAVGEQADFVPDVAHNGGSELTKLTDRVYSFRWSWDRSIVIRTDEGFVVTDPFNKEAAHALAAELAKIAPGVPVHTMIYTHYHLDHVAGGAELAPRHVLAHAKCPERWVAARESQPVSDILPPTQLLDGDYKLVVGGIEIDLLYLGLSHTDTLYAVYVPSERVLHTADMGLVRTVFPIGGPDMYTPGVLRALDRLAKLDFEHYVPSHFGLGTKRDFLEAVEFTHDVRRLSVDVVAKYGPPVTPADYRRSFRYVYDPLKLKYGRYHGFQQQVLFLIGRSFSGVLLGY